MNNDSINNKVIDFWNTSLSLTNENREYISQLPIEQYKELAPSEKLFLATSSLGKCDRVLDYGCGNGWASIIIKKAGTKDVEAVDVGENIIESAKCYFDHFQVDVNVHSITLNWLKNSAKTRYNGVFCSNVLDVVPLETSKEIIENLARICLPNASIIIGLNFYMSKESASSRGMELIEDKYLFVDGVLRLLSLSDEDWIKLFEPYFIVKKLEHFAWPNEQVETRRLFYLVKR